MKVLVFLALVLGTSTDTRVNSNFKPKGPIQNLIIDSSFTPPQVRFSLFKAISGDFIITNYNGTVGSLELNVGGSLKINQSPPRKPGPRLERDIVDIQIRNLTVTDSIEISKIHDLAIKLTSTKLNTVSIQDCPTLKRFPFPLLRQVKDMIISNTAIENLNNVFVDPIIILKDYVIKGYRHEKLTLNVKQIGGKLKLEDNKILETVHLLGLESLGNRVFVKRCPKLKHIRFTDMAIYYTNKEFELPKVYVAATNSAYNPGMDFKRTFKASKSTAPSTNHTPSTAANQPDYASNQSNNKTVKFYITIVIPIALILTILLFILVE